MCAHSCSNDIDSEDERRENGNRFFLGQDIQTGNFQEREDQRANHVESGLGPLELEPVMSGYQDFDSDGAMDY